MDDINYTLHALAGDVEREAKAGDIIYVQHSVYKHFGIYTGRKTNHVIHYTPNEYSIGKAIIHETSLRQFMDDADTYYVVPGKSLKQAFSYVYSRHESLDRAKSKIGENAYHLFDNNCEAFAFWCRTGIRWSSQSKRPENALPPLAQFAIKLIKHNL